MKITKRPLRNAHAALFSPTGDWVYTTGDYLCGYATPSLKRLFRVRGYIGSSCIATHLSGDKLVLAYADGTIEIRDGKTGKLDRTLRLGTAVQHFAVSPCGQFGAVCRSDGVAIIDLRSAEELWSRAEEARHVDWLSTSSAFLVITAQSQAEIWSWPPEGEPRSTIQLSDGVHHPALLGTRLATDSYSAISVKDLSDGAEIFSVPYRSLFTPYWLRDGKLVVMRRDACDLYAPDGELLHRTVAPTLNFYGHAFSPVRDDAVLCYFGGIVFVEGFQSFMSAHEELPIPLVEREVHPATSEDLCNFPEESAEQRTVEASTPAELMQALKPFQRTAWVPELVEESSAPECSKFGGVPWLSRNEPWPRCGQCGGYMNLFLQLNSTELPDQARQYIDGLLQVFVCTYETFSGACESFLAFSNAALVRICQPSGPPGFSELPDPELYDEQHVVGWTKRSDLPDDRELQTMGVTLSDEQQAMQIDGVNFPIEGDKLLGWPAWQQNVESRECPLCHEAMRPIFQIDSCHGVPALLGDGGRGWIVQCPKHRETVAFHWTC